jgi:hypothetical protein
VAEAELHRVGLLSWPRRALMGAQAFRGVLQAVIGAALLQDAQAGLQECLPSPRFNRCCFRQGGSCAQVPDLVSCLLKVLPGSEQSSG